MIVMRVTVEEFVFQAYLMHPNRSVVFYQRHYYDTISGQYEDKDPLYTCIRVFVVGLKVQNI